MVAKNSAEHHYHEVSGKSKIPTTKDVFVSFGYYLFAVFARKVMMHKFENYCLIQSCLDTVMVP